MSYRCRIIAPLCTEVDTQGLITAIYHIIKNRLVAALHVEGLENEKFHRVLHVASLILRPIANIHDVLVVLRFRIDFAVSLAGQFFIGARHAELVTAGERLALFDDDLGDFG